MKNTIIATILALTAISVNAAELSGSVFAASDYMYRGQSITGSDPTVGANLLAENIFVDGTFATVGVTAINPSPIDDLNEIRTDVGIGYASTLGKLEYSVGLHRVFNPIVERSDDYNEVRTTVGYPINQTFKAVGELSVITSGDLGRDIFAAGGIEASDVFTDGLDLSAKLTQRHFSRSDLDTLNAFEVGASYAVTPALEVFGLYSVGGDTVQDLFDSEFRFNTVDNSSGGLVGIRYSFN